MSVLSTLPVVLALASARHSGAIAQVAAEATLAVARFRAVGDSTRVVAFVRVPALLLKQVGAGGAGILYRVVARLVDGNARFRWDSSWTRAAPRPFLEWPSGADVFTFVVHLAPGRYVLTCTVTAPSGRAAVATQTVETLSASALASDLVLAAGRPSDVGVARVAVGSTTLVDPVWPELTEGSAALRYYLEIYPPDSVTRAPDSLFLWVEDSAGARRVVGPATLAARPRAESALDLRSLPAGRYRFGVALWGGPAGDTTVRWAEFRIAPRVEPADLFSAAGEERLDSLYAPLFHLMAGDERGAYSSLPVDGKRAYLRRFWARRDPTPGTPRNESAETFYARIAYADRVFREGGAAEIPGWRTDRGRIYFLNGAPDEVLRRPQPASTQPYEVWKYTRGRARKYVFFDLTRFGNYTLIYTNDIHEPSRPNWWELLDTEALEEVLRF